MALTNLTNNLMTRVAPLDVGLQFAADQVLTATGFVNNVNTQLDLNIGRFDGMLILDLLALDVSSGNETYEFMLLGSNDPAFGAGNCELLAFHDFAAATAGRVLASFYLGASPVVPAPGQSVRRHAIPFSNLMGDYLLRYLQLYLVAGGTTPSVTLNSWVTDRESMI
jgi:hypothetical protein